MKKFAAIAVAASMFALAACKDKPADPTPPVIDEPDSPRPVKEDPCNKGYQRPGQEGVKCK